VPTGIKLAEDHVHWLVSIVNPQVNCQRVDWLIGLKFAEELNVCSLGVTYSVGLMKLSRVLLEYKHCHSWLRVWKFSFTHHEYCQLKLQQTDRERI
jgi:REP element-mobilizing transposase RayT